MPINRIDNKEHLVSFRLKETDYLNLRLMMERHNYMSMSKFIRDSIFNRKLSTKPLPYSGDGIRGGILLYTQQLNKIGNNYNQNVHRIHTLSEMKRKNGDPVIHTKIILDIEQNNKKLMERILANQNALTDFTEKAVDNIESHIGTIYAKSSELMNSFRDALKVQIRQEGAEPIILKSYIMGNEDAYNAFTELLSIICKIEDLSKDFENITNQPKK